MKKTQTQTQSKTATKDDPQKDKFQEQSVKIEEKINYHKEKLETLQAKKVILDSKIRKRDK